MSADLSSSHLATAYLTSSHLHILHLHRSYIFTDLTSSDLTSADLTSSHLKSADLTSSDLAFTLSLSLFASANFYSLLRQGGDRNEVRLSKTEEKCDFLWSGVASAAVSPA
jgi:uncharacterized protein YjbI with pentapeptide repeats